MAVNPNLESSFMYLSYLSSVSEAMDMLIILTGDSLWVYTVKINKRKPQLKLERGRTAEGALLPHHSSSITPNRKTSVTDPTRKRTTLNSQTGNATTLLPQLGEGRLSSSQQQVQWMGKDCRPANGKHLQLSQQKAVISGTFTFLQWTLIFSLLMIFFPCPALLTIKAFHVVQLLRVSLPDEILPNSWIV